MTKEQNRPEPPKQPPSWADASAWSNWEDEMVRYQDSTSWEKPQTGWDTAMPELTDEDYDNLERYAG